jgi:hypothetical protein
MRAPENHDTLQPWRVGSVRCERRSSCLGDNAGVLLRSRAAQGRGGRDLMVARRAFPVTCSELRVLGVRVRVR